MAVRQGIFPGIRQLVSVKAEKMPGSGGKTVYCFSVPKVRLGQSGGDSFLGAAPVKILRGSPGKRQFPMWAEDMGEGQGQHPLH